LGDYFEEIAAGAKYPKALANWLINGVRARLAVANEHALAEAGSMGLEPEEVVPLTVQDLKFPKTALPQLVELVEAGRISSRIAQDVFAEMVDTGASPEKIVERHGWVQVSDTNALEAFCDEAIQAHPGPAADYRGGKEAALNFLKGQVMKLSKGKANPALVGDILQQKLRD
jgi:aspartyl-tRNA(Asn)/glutamyl-tRNA(Gln) amidotransferase subunit B